MLLKFYLIHEKFDKMGSYATGFLVVEILLVYYINSLGIAKKIICRWM